MKHRLAYLSFFFFFISINIFPQYLRKVIVEEATNASCGPCASQNPTFKKWINNHLDRVIPVIYHAWWPGSSDPMYTYNKDMNQKRINYYGISSVPMGRINGKVAPSSGSFYAGAVADTIALNNQLNNEALYSMIGIEITEFKIQNNGNGNIKISVTSIKPISDVYLRIVVCEEHHYYANAGTNGEKDFHWIARTMLPKPEGTLLTLNEKETKSFEFSFTIDTSFIDDLYAVAFIQDDKTKEILQGTWTKNYPSKLPKFALFVDQSSLVNVGKSGDNFEMEGYIINNTNNTATFNVSLSGIEKLPSDWKAIIENNQTKVVVNPNSIAPIKAKLTVGFTPIASDIRFNIQNPNEYYSELGPSLNIFHQNVPRLHILAGENQHSIQSIIENALGNNYMFNITETDFLKYSPKFQSLKTIVWNGSTNGEFTASSANIIIDALSKNMNILICGGRITSGMNSNGILSYFGISFIAYCREGFGQAPYPVTLAGVQGDPITGDFGNNIQGYLINYLLPLYKIVNTNTTTPILTFAKSKDSICAVKVQWTKNRAIILGMNPYVIYDENLRQTLISRSLQWLESSSSEVQFDFGLDKEMEIYPNPTNSYSYLKFSLEKPVVSAKIELVDLLGQFQKTIYSGSIASIGQQIFPIDTKDFASQILYLRVNLDGNVKILPITIMK
ncbi:MAG: hypothetical protein N2560_09835 [Ignavibacteria bacterium]|nr:hypothetical protein [Ignavibacteria bacterium]